MSFSSVEVYAKEYFHTLNPIAQRISSDVAATRDAYEDLWITLSYKDQRQVLDETIIHPEAVLKYSFFPKNQPEVEYFPRLRIQTGEKYVHDDEGGKGNGFSWRDEHSAPFSFMTRSQLNLSAFSDTKSPTNLKKDLSKSNTPTKKIAEGFIDPPSIVLGGSTSKLSTQNSKFPQESNNLLTKLKNKTAVLKIQALKNVGHKENKGKDSEKETLIQRSSTLLPVTKITKKVSKPKTPPPPPPPTKKESQQVSRSDPEKKALLQESPGDEIDSVSSHGEAVAPLPNKHTPAPTTLTTTAALEANISLESLQEFHSALNSPTAGSDSDDLLPKTGFDFLDNW